MPEVTESGARSKRAVRAVHYALLAALIVLAFSFHLWINRQRWKSQMGGVDFRNCITLGRQFAEFHSLPTFRYPGKTYGAPMKAFTMYWPCALFGYREWIPPVMASLNIVLVGLGCYLIARQAISPAAGLFAFALAMASDRKLVGYVFRPAYGFDVILMLGLFVGAFAVGWVKRYRRDGTQPGFLYCLLMGAAAGLLIYTHPIGAVPIGAAAVFLALSLGLKAFTWRPLAAALGAVIGSARLWMFYLRCAQVRDSWTRFAKSHPRTLSIPEIVGSREGMVWYTLSPSDNMIMRLWLGLGLALVLGLAGWGIARWVRGLDRRKAWACVRGGFPLPPWSAGLFALLCMTAFAIKTQGASDASADWNYHTELWFWYTVGGAFTLHLLWRRSRPAAWAAAAVLTVYFGAQTAGGFPASPAKDVGVWERIKRDAHELVRLGHNRILTGNPRYYHYFALGPSGLFLAERHRPWVRDAAEIVEQAEEPAVISGLTPATLGGVCWETDKLEAADVYHSFRMPAGGVVLSNASLRITIDGKPAPAVCDDNFATLWWGRQEERQGGHVISVVLDQPRRICRVCMYVERGEADWTYYTYPDKLLIEGRTPDGEWVTLTGAAEPDGFFWDSGRLFHAERERKRFDIRFAPALVTELRMTDKAEDDWRERKISEMYVFEEGPAGGGRGTIRALLEVEGFGAGTDRVLADRFVSAQVERTYPGIETWVPMFLRPMPFHMPRRTDPWPWSNDLDPVAGDRTVVIAEEAFAPRVEALLAEDGVEFSRHDFGSWIAYWALRKTIENEPSTLVWNGFCVGRCPNKSAARYHLRQAEGLIEQGDSAAALRRLRATLALDPRCYEAGRLAASIEGGEQGGEWPLYAPPQEPLSPPVAFDDGTLLLGCDVNPREVGRGGSFTVSYHWAVTRDWISVFSRPWVFAHFGRDGFTLNDDHLLLYNYPMYLLRDGDGRQALVTTRTVRVPDNAPPGAYDLEVGLHRRTHRVRILSKENDQADRKEQAVKLPGITVL